MNIVIYARFSSHSQNEQSIEGQLNTCYEYAKKNDYTVIGEYIDRALSGTTDNRPEFQRMIDDSSKKLFNGVLVYQLDRFARNRYDSAIYKSRLKKNGVRVFSARENISDDASGILVEGLLESMAEYYSAELSQKITRGMSINASKCLSTGGHISLGYKIDINKKYVIDEETAPIVVKIFEMYASGKTVKQIIEHLNSMHIKTSKGTEFNKNSLGNILKNKRYIGIYTYNGTEIKDGLPRIVSDELFYKAADIMSKNRLAPARSRSKMEFILTLKLFCGHCRDMMTGSSGKSKNGSVYYYYTCNNVKRKQCSKKSVKKVYIENLVIDECRKLLTPENTKKISDALASLFNNSKDNDGFKKLEKLKKDAEKKRSNLIDAISSCDIDNVRKSLFVEVQRMENTVKEIDEQISKEKLTQVRMTAPEIRFYMSLLRKGDINDINYRKTLVNIFVNSIYLYDDRITMIFNISSVPYTAKIDLIDDIERSEQKSEGLLIGHLAPPNGK